MVTILSIIALCFMYASSRVEGVVGFCYLMVGVALTGSVTTLMIQKWWPILMA